MQLRGIDHVAIAVRDLRRAVELYVDALGGTFIAGGDDDHYGMRTVQVALPTGAKVELIQPVRPDSPYQRFIDEHGEGFHHLTVFVDDVEAVEQRLHEHGFETVDTHLDQPEWRETYVRPKSCFRALLQVADTTKDWSIPVTDHTVDDVLAGKLMWDGSEVVRREAIAEDQRGDVAQRDAEAVADEQGPA